MSMIEIAPVSIFKSPTLVSGVLNTKLSLAGSVTVVQSGTPLRPSDDEKFPGWVVARDGLGEFVASTGGSGGDIIDGLRVAVVNYHREPLYRLPYFEVGRRYRVQDVDDKGVPEFVLDPAGLFLAVSKHNMLLDMSATSLYLRAKETKGPDVADKGAKRVR